MVFMGEENFLKKAFLPPNPQLSKTLKQGFYFFIIILCAYWLSVLCSRKPMFESFRPPFSKGGEGLGREAP